MFSVTALGVDFTDSLLNTKYFDAAEFIFNSLVERFMKFWLHSPYTFRFSSLKKKQDSCLETVHKLSDTVRFIYKRLANTRNFVIVFFQSCLVPIGLKVMLSSLSKARQKNMSKKISVRYSRSSL